MKSKYQYQFTQLKMSIKRHVVKNTFLFNNVGNMKQCLKTIKNLVFILDFK